MNFIPFADPSDVEEKPKKKRGRKKIGRNV